MFTVCELLVLLRCGTVGAVEVGSLTTHQRHLAGVLALASTMGIRNLNEFPQGRQLDRLQEWVRVAAQGVTERNGEAITEPTPAETKALGAMMRKLLGQSKEAQGLDRVATSMGLLTAEGKLLKRPQG